MDSSEFRRSKKKKKGQTTCNNCGKLYNNNSVPSLCSCNHFLGGKWKPDTKATVARAFLITSALASVREHDQGENKRIFASLGDQKKVKH